VGCSDLRIIARHIFPNSIYPVIIMASLGIGGTVLTAAALSFLGIGAPQGYADWGQMISFARNWIWAGFQDPWKYWYTFTIPGVAIFFFVLGWNLLGDALRDILDPKLRGGIGRYHGAKLKRTIRKVETKGSPRSISQYTLE
jgi:peptide/nickel transport system permease protein